MRDTENVVNDTIVKEV